jgi:RNase P/RNase MRP subunit p30
MKRLYSDLHLCPDLTDRRKTLNLIKKAASLGYCLVGITLPPNLAEKDLQRLRDDCRETGVDLAPRVDLRPMSPGELTRNVRKLRRRFEIVSVICDSKNVSRQAAKDRRVDFLSFRSVDARRRFFDLAEAELASNSLASLEVDTKPLLALDGPARIRLLSSLRKETTIAKDFHVPIVVSSGTSSELLLRRPMEQAALAFLFDLDKNSALDAVSRNPAWIVRRNREKLGPRFVAPGIRVIRRGKDC